MTFNSMNFLIFFPVVLLLYYVLPKKIRWVWLLFASYYFYASWSVKYLSIIIGVTLVSFAGALLIDKKKEKYGIKKLILAVSIILILCVLIAFKYMNFFITNINSIIERLGKTESLELLSFVLPVGISFYSFQAIGYLIDVYRGDVKAEKNLFKYALFVSFFPQLVAGPIERSKNLISQIYETHEFDRDRVISGFLLMCFGFFKKVVIADRAAIIVNLVYANYSQCFGLQIIFATIIFAIQLYCDFSGYSDIAIGSARILGFTLTKNFKSPYYSLSVAEFWRRWHISLSTWFKDYVYIPLGGNRKGKVKTYRNIIITFTISGLWHGANWTYIIWGLLNGIYQVAGNITKGLRGKLVKLLNIKTECFSFRLLKGLITFALIDFSFVFFRAASLADVRGMLTIIKNNFGIMSLFDVSKAFGIQTFGLDEKDFWLMITAIVVLLVLDAVKEKYDLTGFVIRQNLIFRYITYFALVVGLIIFGYYGPLYDASTFIYFQF